MAKVELTLVCENTASTAGILGEHGLSWFIRTDTHSILFDTGQGLALKPNCRKLGIDLSALDAVILSHGHYDHVSGLCDVLEANSRCMIYAHKEVCADKFSRTPGGSCKCLSISLLTDPIQRKGWGERLKLIEESIELIPGIYATGFVPRTTSFEDVGGPFFLDSGLQQPDPLDDDLSLYFETAEGICVVLGCAHSGLINILRQIRVLTGGKPISAVYGGMHLLNASEERLSQTIAELRRLGTPRFYPNHCTGFEALHRLWEAFPERVLPASAGMSWKF